VRRTSTIRFKDLLLARAIAVADSSLKPRLSARLLDHIFDVDYERNGGDGWDLARLACETVDHAPSTEASATRLTEALSHVRSRNRACVYLFGTGPSLSRANDRDFTDGLVVVCNTIVRDVRLWNHLAPDVLVAGDAIYHFGHTPHARAFRRDALARLTTDSPNAVFIYPAIFDPIVRLEFASIAERLIPVPLGEHTDVTVDLLREHTLPYLGNVLNLLLLPVGCTLSSDVRLWGFDGRAPSDQLFWSNSNNHSYPELLNTVREAHPAFFAEMVPAGREASYVQSVHGDDLDEQMTNAEARGFRFSMLHFSWTATLQRRGLVPNPTISDDA
jgi:hypothetical protein